MGGTGKYLQGRCWSQGGGRSGKTRLFLTLPNWPSDLASGSPLNLPQKDLRKDEKPFQGPIKTRPCLYLPTGYIWVKQVLHTLPSFVCSSSRMGVDTRISGFLFNSSIWSERWSPPEKRQHLNKDIIQGILIWQVLNVLPDSEAIAKLPEVGVYLCCKFPARKLSK